ncbi:hypothetical protein [Streptomyces sp. UNOB3_S3]|uniref:hypothetical protein n=1 Tax=Streptomyces sp. UNOB3_S3 TaxID=2871682 RepID=UPI001E325122|nr:hypothetical protein [Streptomyces sp. UNOB3_S3]MCC3776605.1 hypothetical protein [Streptomyces sp. UNOB3_S3]
MDSSRERDPYRDTDDYVEDMTEETLGRREQSRQSIQAQERDRLNDDLYEDQSDQDDLDDLQ